MACVGWRTQASGFLHSRKGSYQAIGVNQDEALRNEDPSPKRKLGDPPAGQPSSWATLSFSSVSQGPLGQFPEMRVCLWSQGEGRRNRDHCLDLEKTQGHPSHLPAACLRRSPLRTKKSEGRGRSLLHIQRRHRTKTAQLQVRPSRVSRLPDLADFL